MRLTLAAATVAAVSTLVPPGAAARVALPQQTPGVTATTVVLGATVPLSGAAASSAGVAHGANAYLKHVNAGGGVHGRRIVYRVVDDGSEPARTVQGTRQLVESEGVFAIFNSFGTETSLAVQPYLNQLKIPQLFVGTGASAIGDGFRAFPWTIGYGPSFVGEGAIYGRILARTRPLARIAVLQEDSLYGADLLRGLRRGLAGKTRIVAIEEHARGAIDVSAQLASLRGSGADTLMLFTTPPSMIQAFIQANKLGWRPQTFVTLASVEPTVMRSATLSAGARATEGATSIAFLKDPASPRWAKDRGVVLYRQVMRRHYPGGRITDLYNLYGMAVAHTMVSTLRQAGRNLTRASLLRAATGLDERENPFLLPGIVVRTSATNYHPISRAQLYRFRRGRWQPAAGLFGARG